MKRTLAVLIFASISVSALAQQQGFVSSEGQGYAQGGFKGPAPGVFSVDQARGLRDEVWVVLEGRIVKQIGHEIYEFRDNTGTINVEIDDKRWQGITVSPNERIRIEGEIDKDWNSVEIDVKNINITK